MPAALRAASIASAAEHTAGQNAPVVADAAMVAARRFVHQASGAEPPAELICGRRLCVAVRCCRQTGASLSQARVTTLRSARSMRGAPRGRIPGSVQWTSTSARSAVTPSTTPTSGKTQCSSGCLDLRSRTSSPITKATSGKIMARAVPMALCGSGPLMIRPPQLRRLRPGTSNHGAAREPSLRALLNRASRDSNIDVAAASAAVRRRLR
eukprot:SAG11_NODE_621_length_8169_cov_2.866914_1_plen_210_part_00